MVIIPAAISLLQSLISSIPLFKLRPSAYNRYRYSDYPCSTPFTGISLKASLSCSMVIIPAAISLLQSLISSMPLFKLRPSACNRYRFSDYPCSTPFTGISLKASLSCSMVIIPAAISLLQSLISSMLGLNSDHQPAIDTCLIQARLCKIQAFFKELEKLPSLNTDLKFQFIFQL